MIQLPTELPPQSVEMEQGVLGSCLLSASLLDTLVERLQPEDFCLSAHRIIFSVMVGMRRLQPPAPVDELTLADRLKELNFLDSVGGTKYVLALIQSGLPPQAEYYAGKVLDYSIRRIGAHVGGEIQDLFRESDDLETAISRAAALLDGVRDKRGRERCRLRSMSLTELLASEFSAPRWIVPEILPVGVSLLAGPPKVKKSFLALCLGISLATGGPAFGSVPLEAARGLCVFLEDRFPEVKERAQQLLGDINRVDWLEVSEDCPRMDEGGEQELDRWLIRHPDTRYVVLDPLMRVRGGQARSQNASAYAADYEDMAAFKRLVDRHQVALLILHHTRKLQSEDWVQQLSGSTGLAGAADALYLLQSERNSKEAILRGTGRRVREFEWVMTWDDFAGWQYSGDAKAHAQNKGQDAVFVVLREAPGKHLKLNALVEAVCDVTNEKPFTVKKRIQRMETKGLLRGTAGLYWLPEETGTGDTGDRGHDSVFVPVPIRDTPEQENGVSPVPLSLTGTGDTGDRGHISENVPVPDAERGHGDRGHADSESDPIRQTVLEFARRCGFPALEVGDSLIKAGEAEWVWICREWHPQALAAVEQGLEGLSG